METITIDKNIITDMARVIQDLNDRMESLELASNPEVMESLKKSKEEIKNRDFGNWDEL